MRKIIKTLEIESINSLKAGDYIQQKGKNKPLKLYLDKSLNMLGVKTVEALGVSSGQELIYLNQLKLEYLEKVILG